MEHQLSELFQLATLMKKIFYDEKRTELRDKFQLNTSQFNTLICLSKNGAMTMSELSDRLGLVNSSVTSLTDSLMKRRYVKKETDDADKRRSCLALTDEGESLAQELKRQHIAYITEREAALSAKDRKKLSECVSGMNEILARLADMPRDRNPEDK